MQEKKIKVGITQGDINGIGYEVLLKVISNPAILEICTPILYGSPKVMGYHRKMLEIPSFNYSIINSASEAADNRINIVNCGDEETKVEIGKATQTSGEAALASLTKATDEYANGLFDVLLTSPINKETIQSETFKFPGHTEFLEQKLGNESKAMMILIKDNLRVALVTGHIPLSSVASSITKDDLVNKIKAFSKTLAMDFGIQKPRIAVLALNPHAGDGGVIGNEEIETIIPALKESQEKGILTFGPYPADGFFGSGQFTKFDGVLAMFHDQGLAPFKTIAMDLGVNYTAGLPIIRTSPAHGTAYDIASKNIASEESFLQALYMAIDVFRARIRYNEARKNPLRKQYFEKGNDNEKLNLKEEHAD
ncbi:MAG: 4-hydroxythreonine-4-phosphate dehydrogenase PdxA [Bacteroidales bacterium]|nr:4-hydroxythreonine-4-phosphate dehydrogenase PdxA [Bacteroidales bacterium]